ncbi:hypothetical protein Tco_0546688, partial [Tanacetum coccineum]
ICGDHGSGFLPRRLALSVAFNLGRAITSKKTFSEPVQLSQISPIPGTVSSGPIHNGPDFHQERLAFQRHWSGRAEGQ